MFAEVVNFFAGIDDALLTAVTGGRPDHFPWILIPLLATFGTIWVLGGRTWAMIYFITIPFLNWSFGVIQPWGLLATQDIVDSCVAACDPEMLEGCTRSCQPFFGVTETFAKGVELHPLTMVTGLVFVFRDFVQRGMGQKVLVVMALAIAWSFYYAWPVIALASGIAFAVSEMADWALYTFTKYRLSTRILLSSALASPIDTTIFLYGADLAMQMNLGSEPGSMLHWANWVVFIIGKMVGAVIVSYAIRRREDAGLIDPASV